MLNRLCYSSRSNYPKAPRHGLVIKNSLFASGPKESFARGRIKNANIP